MHAAEGITVGGLLAATAAVVVVGVAITAAAYGIYIGPDGSFGYFGKYR